MLVLPGSYKPTSLGRLVVDPCPNMIGTTADAAEAFAAQYPHGSTGQASESSFSLGKFALSETRIPLTAFSSFA